MPPYHLAYVYSGLDDPELTPSTASNGPSPRKAGAIYGIKGTFFFWLLLLTHDLWRCYTEDEPRVAQPPCGLMRLARVAVRGTRVAKRLRVQRVMQPYLETIVR